MKKIIPKSPEDIRPLPKAGARKQGRQHPRKRSTTILTDTPEKDKLEAIKKCQVKKTCNDKKVKKKITSNKKEYTNKCCK